MTDSGRDGIRRAIERVVGGSLDGKTVVSFGAGGSAQEFIAAVGSGFFAFAVDNDARLWGTVRHGLEVRPPEVCQRFADERQLVVVINSSFQVPILRQLQGMGLNLPQHQINGLTFTLLRPTEIYSLQPRCSLEMLFQQLNTSVRYAVIRSFERMPHESPDYDVDLLVDAADAEILRNLGCISTSEEQAGLGIECYWVPPLDRAKLQYFPRFIAEPALRQRRLWNGSVSVPEDRWALLLLAHTCLYLKSPRKTGLGLVYGERFRETKYTNELIRLAHATGYEDLDLSGQGLQQLLRAHRVESPLDWARQVEMWRRSNGEETVWLRDFLKPASRSPAVELVVLVLRDCAMNSRSREFIEGRIASAGQVTPVGFHVLSHDERLVANELMRSGNWAADENEAASGNPAAILLLADAREARASSALERQVYPYRGNSIYSMKNELRRSLSDAMKLPPNCNPIHSPDDEREALQYLSLLGNWRELVPEDLLSETDFQEGRLLNHLVPGVD